LSDTKLLEDKKSGVHNVSILVSSSICTLPLATTFIFIVTKSSQNPLLTHLILDPLGRGCEWLSGGLSTVFTKKKKWKWMIRQKRCT
jgi:hypothetical protein